MTTNLVFKRTVTKEGIQQTEMKIIEVYIPELKSAEGWSLVSSADKVTRVEFAKCQSSEELEEERAVKAFRDKYRVAKAKEKIEKTFAEGTQIITDSDPDIYKNKEEVTRAIETSQFIKYDKITEIPANTPGTACLIRKGDTIRIAYRSGTKADLSTPNKVCINDYDKQHFFNAVKKNHGTNNSVWQLTSTDPEYEHWNSAMDTYYQEQRRNYFRYLEEKSHK